jgi:hypothetical protein
MSSLGPVTVASVHATRSAGLTNDDLGQVRDRGPQAIPDPFREDFAGGVVEPFDLVEVVVVEAGQERGEGARQLAEVLNPTRFFPDRSVHVHSDPVGVSVQACTLMARGYVREPVGRLEGELPEDLHSVVSSILEV